MICLLCVTTLNKFFEQLDVAKYYIIDFLYTNKKVCLRLKMPKGNYIRVLSNRAGQNCHFSVCSGHICQSGVTDFIRND